MTFSIHDAATPMFVRGLTSLLGLIDKAEASGLDEATIMQARLAEDMRPFPTQIQMACFSARGAVSRLTGVETFRTADDEASLAELRQTVERTLEYLNSVPVEAFGEAGTRAVQLKLPTMTLDFEGAGYLTSFALPNFYFHLSMAYAILRHLGVELGKRDYLGQLALTGRTEV